MLGTPVPLGAPTPPPPLPPDRVQVVVTKTPRRVSTAVPPTVPEDLPFAEPVPVPVPLAVASTIASEDGKPIAQICNFKVHTLVFKPLSLVQQYMCGMSVIS